MNRLDFIEKDSLRRDLPPFRVGDQVRVHVKVREGDKERIQVFEGLCLRRRGGSAGETFTVRKISNGVGVERIFPVQSPLVTKLEIMSRGFVRRSRLYYLRDLTGKKARLHSKVRDVSHLISPEEEDARAADAAGDEGSKARKKRGKKAKAARGSSKSDAAAEKKAAKKESRKTAKKSAKAEPKAEPKPEPKAESKAEAEAAAPEVVAEEAAAPEVVAEEPAATEESES